MPKLLGGPNEFWRRMYDEFDEVKKKVETFIKCLDAEGIFSFPPVSRQLQSKWL